MSKSLTLVRGATLSETGGRCGGRKREQAQAVAVPNISKTLLWWFTRYTKSYVSRHFHTVRVSREGYRPGGGTRPVILYSNHASWWDPLAGLIIKSHFFPDYRFFAPIDLKGVQKYGFFKKLGFFGVEQNTRRGALTFLRTSEAILSEERHGIWVTPQGRFADVREKPISLRPGLGHLALRFPAIDFVPVAFEYCFWEEKSPEILVRIGEPLRYSKLSGQSLNAEAMTAELAAKLERTQEALARECIQRRPEHFEVILGGKVGVGGVYDLWRRLRGWVTGEKVNLAHSSK